MSGVRRKRGLASDSHAESEAKRKTSFELFLSTLPKLDPIDRTVGWVFQLPSSSTTTLMVRERVGSVSWLAILLSLSLSLLLAP